MNLLILWTILFSVVPAPARVATAPNSADQRLINPAVSALRETFGISLDVSRQTDSESVLGLKDASIGIETKIQTVNTNTAFRTGGFFWEFSVSPQSGTKNTEAQSQTDSGPNHSETSAKLSLFPAQLTVAIKPSTNFSAGLKAMYTGYGFNDRSDLFVATYDYNEDIDESRTVKGSFLVAAPGFLYQLGKSGFSVAYLAEFMQFRNDRSVRSSVDYLSVTLASGGGNNVGTDETRLTDFESSDTIVARKDIVGVGFKKKFMGKNNIRLDASYERMPPLTKTPGYPYGELIRLIAESNFLYFRLGVEATRKTGYYIDPYNLIPYFFKIDHLGTDPVQELSFFGGLKSSKGHSVGAVFSKSTSTSSQRLAEGSSPQSIEKKSTRYGISYSYFF